MSVRVVLDLVVEGDGETETSLRETIAAIKAEFSQSSSAYHEIMAYIATVALRHEWLLADMYRKMEQDRERRRLARRRDVLEGPGAEGP